MDKEPLDAKPGFLTELKATAIPPNLWRLDAELQYVTFVNGVAELIVAETGFVNDLASIPRLFRTFVPAGGKERLPSVIHDKGYRTQGKGVLFNGGDLTRKQVDFVFNEGMEAEGVRWAKRKIIYRGVRAGGWWAWRKNGKKK